MFDSEPFSKKVSIFDCFFSSAQRLEKIPFCQKSLPYFTFIDAHSLNSPFVFGSPQKHSSSQNPKNKEIFTISPASLISHLSISLKSSIKPHPKSHPYFFLTIMDHRQISSR
eukprot:Sdes_comp20731_c0_seq4m16537